MLPIPNYNVQNLCLLQTLWQEFKASLSVMVVGVSQEELEPQEGTNMDPSTSLPPWVLQTHQQHTTDYVRLMMETEMSLTMGEDQSTPLITEVFSQLTSHVSF